MKIHHQSKIVDNVLDGWRIMLGSDFIDYRNHCYRMLNFCLAFCSEHDDAVDKVSIAAVFHDLSTWAGSSISSLASSRRMIREYLLETDLSSWCEEIETMIEFRHKDMKYSNYPDWLVEPFRKADWINRSEGRLKFGLSADYVAAVMVTFPGSAVQQHVGKLSTTTIDGEPCAGLVLANMAGGGR